MGFLGDLLSAPGWIYGPLMLLTGVMAGGACGWATLGPGRRSARRAVWWSIVPAAMGLIGAVLGALAGRSFTVRP